MVAMQSRLDSTREDFFAFCRSLRGAQFEIKGIHDFFRVSEELEALDRVRRMSNISESDFHIFQKLQAEEPHLKSEVIRLIPGLVEVAERQGNGQLSSRFAGSLDVFKSIAAQEASLYRARRDWGRLILESTKNALPIGSGNQIFDIAKSDGQSPYRVQEMRRVGDACVKRLDHAWRHAVRATVAEYYGAGNCGEQAAWAATEINRLLPGEKLAMSNWADGKGNEHSYVTIGLPNFPETAYIDAWPENASVTNCFGYGLPYTRETSIIWEREGNGKDLRAEVLKAISKILPKIPQEYPRVDIENKSVKAMWITRTTDGYNSDSDSDSNRRPDRGFTISPSGLAQRYPISDALPQDTRPGPSASSQATLTARAARIAMPGQAGSGYTAPREMRVPHEAAIDHSRPRQPNAPRPGI
ncbi:hypothetical protein ACIPPJ_07040 [Streptomyces sp. NPDC086091]|uniref:hypothetical protein n=1 Tax=Streptomyces sp. NPDC086091 TaxID=3365751 RepID=UPI00382C632B